MSDLTHVISKSITSTMSGSGAKMIDVSVINEAIKALLAVKGQPPGTDVELPLESLYAIASLGAQVFMSQPMLLEVVGPCRIVGDTHGQYSDLLRIFEIGGFPPKVTYVFLGDYVDRGKQSIETLALLLCFKIKFPTSIFLLRGNHECSSLNRIYGFFDECKRRYNVKVWKYFSHCFNCMPVAAIVDNRIFCVHGGISQHIENLSDIYQLPRPTDIPDSGILCDLLWADPDFAFDEWGPSMRGVSCSFGPVAADKFLTAFKLDLICRAHQVVEDGYEFSFDRQVVTVFSAPNYCGEFDNAGAIMTVNQDLVCSFKVIRPVTHKRKFPILFPDYIDSDECNAVRDRNDSFRDLSYFQDHLPSAAELVSESYDGDDSDSSLMQIELQKSGEQTQSESEEGSVKLNG